MKTIEQKAKAYDEALEKSKEFYILCKKCGAKDTVDFLEDSFPELRKSEDEKIREELAAFVKLHLAGLPKCDRFITWLEKQGQKSTELHKEDEQNLNACLSYIPDEFLRRWLTDAIHVKYDKPVMKIEDEEYDGEDYGIDSLWHAHRILEKTLGEVDGYQTDDGILSHKCAITAVKKLYEQKPAEWSDVDEADLNNIIWLCNNCINGSETTWIPSQATRIKSLIERIKDTVFLQPRQEWNEEDEKMVANIRSMIEKYAFSQSAVDVNGDLCEKIYIDADNWIKSIKQRIGWKPSDEQITWLYRAADDASKDSRMKQILNELLSDLKKL